MEWVIHVVKPLMEKQRHDYVSTYSVRKPIKIFSHAEFGIRGCTYAVSMQRFRCRGLVTHTTKFKRKEIYHVNGYNNMAGSYYVDMLFPCSSSISTLCKLRNNDSVRRIVSKKSNIKLSNEPKDLFLKLMSSHVVIVHIGKVPFQAWHQWKFDPEGSVHRATRT